MFKQSKEKSKKSYIIANIISILISYLIFENVYSAAKPYEEIVKKAGKYVKIVTYNYGPALSYSLLFLITSILLLALLYKKTKLFLKIEIIFTNPDLANNNFNLVNFIRELLTLKTLSPVKAVAYLYRISIIIIIINFIISSVSIFSIMQYGFKYHFYSLLNATLLNLFILVISFFISKLIFVLLHNHFLLIEKKLKQFNLD